MLKFSRCRQGIARYSSLRRIKLPHNILRAISTFPTSILKCERVHISSSSINSSAAAGVYFTNKKGFILLGNEKLLYFLVPMSQSKTLFFLTSFIRNSYVYIKED